MSKKNYTTLEVDVLSIGIRSINVFGDWGQYMNIPLSVIEDSDSIDVGDNQNIKVETWFCRKEGIG